MVGARRRIERSAIPRLVPILCVLAFLVQAGAAQCRAPLYRKGMVWEESEYSVFMAVSIPLKDPALPIPLLYRSFQKSQLELPSQVTILGRSLE